MTEHNFFFTVLVFFLISIPSKAQFYSNGDEPASLKWYEIETENFRILYPEGVDSLAKIYGRNLEYYRIPESRSIGMAPGEFQHGKTTAILHAYTTIANGSVVWAPQRMNLNTIQDAYSPDQMPWIKNLAIHESRHSAQMQFGYRGYFKPFSRIFGEMFPGAMAGIYPNLSLLEGDAVTAETALSESGRGRSADFLDYYMLAFDNGDYRNWYRWRYGSQRYYAPDYYAVGYMTVAGMRYKYDDALFSKRYYDYVCRHPLHIGDMQKVAGMASGKKFKTTFSEIMSSFHEIWNKEATARAPFMKGRQSIKTPSRFTEYKYNTYTATGIYSLKSGKTSATVLVRIGLDGKEKEIRPFSRQTSRISYSKSSNRLYWSENIRDPRWSLKGTSVIRCMDPENGRINTISKGSRLFNPSPSPSGKELAVTEYPVKGGSDILIMTSGKGKLLHRIPSPDSIQIVESVWSGSGLYATGISEKGFGIYQIGNGDKFREILNPRHVKINNLYSVKNILYFTCDRTGVNELYSMDPSDGKLLQLTNFRYGAADFCFGDSGDSLYYSVLSTNGKLLNSISTGSLLNKRVSFDDIHKYPVAEKLSEQEKDLEKNAIRGNPYESIDSIKTTTQKRYRKVPHFPHLHSWAPIYFNIDNIQGASHDYNFQLASAGATGFFQDYIGSFSGFAGYSVHENPDKNGALKNSFHLKLNYSGLFPVLEISADCNDRNAYQYRKQFIKYERKYYSRTSKEISGNPYFSEKLLIYVPLQFSSGGWERGVIPQISYKLSNDRYDNAITHLTYHEIDGKAIYEITGQDEGKNVPMSKFTAIVRGYSVRPVAESQIYPKFGIGAEAGYNVRPGMAKSFTPSAFTYVYGYLPGLIPQQGLRLTGIWQRQFGAGSRIRENYLETSPRGFESSSAIKDYLENRYPWQVRLTADYAIPIWAGDWSFLSPAFYIRNFVLTPHFDYSIYGGGNLHSAGFNFAIHMSNFLWLPYDCSLGITTSVNGGSLYNKIKHNNYPSDRIYTGLTFNISM